MPEALFPPSQPEKFDTSFQQVVRPLGAPLLRDSQPTLARRHVKAQGRPRITPVPGRRPSRASPAPLRSGGTHRRRSRRWRAWRARPAAPPGARRDGCRRARSARRRRRRIRPFVRQMRRELLPDGVRDRRSVVREARQSGPQRAFARRAHFAADRIVVVQVERAQQRLERQSLDHQRAEHHRERGQHDQVAIRKRRRAAPAPRRARRCRACRPTR